MRIKFCVLIIFVSNTVLAQEMVVKKLNGKINANTADLEGIYVINLKTEKSAITEKEGYFTIDAMPGDTLLFTAIHLKEIRICLTQDDFQKEEFGVKMETNIHQLREAIIMRYDNINAVALGISPSGIKHLAQAERHLKTATAWNPAPNTDANLMAGGSLTFDPIINLISGRTARIKEELVVEKKLAFMRQIENMFDESHFTDTFKIPLEYVNGFKYYAVENEQFANVLKTKNKTTIEFLLGELAIKYNEIIANEK